ncbi:MAG: hypothetical protein EZS28_032007 [Streblomastix strix]|uniref:Uncharacterized protein n=1 Tax=Streblomastix strix TaxID=222440 RepID=A0A5J4UQM2_9EUKA|nr:MAG: hypothetical protein EZS28_032007 [Streblomastix strix]
MNVVCEGGISTTTINVAFDNITSLLQSGNEWIFYLLESRCNIKATYKGESAQSRYHPYIYSASVTIHNTSQKAEARVEDKFLELGMRRLILEIHEQDIDDLGVKQEYNVENISNTANWISSDKVIFIIPSSFLNDLNVSNQWQISIYDTSNTGQI